MKIKYFFIFILFSLLYFFINYYVGRKILNGINYLFKFNSIPFWIIFGLLSLSYIISSAFNRILPPSITNFLYLIGSFWMGLLMYTLLTFPLLGLINLILSKSSFSKFLTNKYYIFEILLILIVFIFITAIGSFNANKSYVKDYTININKSSFNDDLNIVMVSDIHLGYIIKNKRLSNMVKEINSLNPDIVIIAGDIIDSDIKPFLDNNMANEFSKLKSKYGVFASLGNHDLMTKDENTIVNKLKENSVRVLRDEAILINDSFYIIGRDDISINSFSSNDRKDLKDITKDLDTTKALIVIDHNPKYINDSLEANIDLQLSGHTHKGQICPGNLVTRSMFEVDYGYLKKKNLNVVVSCGYGSWGPPIRIGSRSEIVKINLKKGAF